MKTMKIPPQWHVKYNFENGVAKNMRIFENKKEAYDFARDHGGKVYRC